MIASSIVKKAVVAVTGALLFAFVIGHMIGNLQIYLGRETINNYAEFLHGLPELLWVARFSLLALIALHIGFTIWVARDNSSARPSKYRYNKTVRAGAGSKSMLLSGLVVLSFVVYHLLHFTVQVTHTEYQELYEYKPTGEPVRLVQTDPVDSATEFTMPIVPVALSEADSDGTTSEPTTEPVTETTPEELEEVQTLERDSLPIEERHEYRRDVYQMVVDGFSVPLVSGFYILANVLLGLHLSHGATSMFTTIGLNTPKYRKITQWIGPIGAAVIVAGNVSIPLTILLDHHLLGGTLFDGSFILAE